MKRWKQLLDDFKEKILEIEKRKHCISLSGEVALQNAAVLSQDR